MNETSRENRITEGEKFLANAQKKILLLCIIFQHQVPIVANKFINENDKQQMGFGTKSHPEYATQLKFVNWIFEIYAKKPNWDMDPHPQSVNKYLKLMPSVKWLYKHSSGQ